MLPLYLVVPSNLLHMDNRGHYVPVTRISMLLLYLVDTRVVPSIHLHMNNREHYVPVPRTWMLPLYLVDTRVVPSILLYVHNRGHYVTASLQKNASNRFFSS